MHGHAFMTSDCTARVCIYNNVGAHNKKSYVYNIVQTFINNSRKKKLGATSRPEEDIVSTSGRNGTAY